MQCPARFSEWKCTMEGGHEDAHHGIATRAGWEFLCSWTTEGADPATLKCKVSVLSRARPA